MAFSIAGAFIPPIVCKDNHSLDARHIRRAAEIADKSAGFTAPHPNFGCVIAKGPKIVGEGFLYAEGTKCAELQAVETAGELCRGATAFLNMEPGDCHGDQTAVSAIIKWDSFSVGVGCWHAVNETQSSVGSETLSTPTHDAAIPFSLTVLREVCSGVSRVVLGMRHPLKHLRGNAVRSLKSEGVQVDVLGEDLQSKTMQEALKSCFLVNAPLLYRAASRVPFSVLKYAMTLDGKIAASSGHASWISSKESRHHVFELRGRSDAIIVGGNTVRRDDPRLTIRNGRGHLPVRIVMSQTLNVPEVANLWDVSEVRTIVATQRGARRSFQKLLASKGVEVVEFDFLNPRDVMEYCHDRGYLSIFWECGGTLAASAISSGVIHKVYSFVAPKIIGGASAPSPVGELGMVEMTQALELIDVSYQQVSVAMEFVSFTSSWSMRKLKEWYNLQGVEDKEHLEDIVKIGPDMLISGFLQPIPDLTPVIPSADETSVIDPTVTPFDASIIFFYKTWDPYGAFSNFSPHPLRMPDSNGGYLTWPSVEHYYQAHKFVGVNDPLARDCVEEIKFSKSPEEAARVGRTLQRKHPTLVRSDWETVKIDIMYSALKCKFSIYPHLNSVLLSTEGSVLVEASPHDLFWGGGREGEGLNYLGRLLMQLRSEFLGES